MASICRWVYPEGHKSAGTVAFRRGVGKQECMEIGGKDAQWSEDEWKPHWVNRWLPEADQFPKNANKDATLELRDRDKYRNSIWGQMGEEALLRDRANFGFSPDSTGFYPGGAPDGGDLQGRMTVPPQPQGNDFSPGTIWNQDMLNTSAANRKLDLEKYPNYTGFQDNDPSFADILSENPEQIYGPKNRMGEYAWENGLTQAQNKIPINQPTDINGQPISSEFQAGGDAQALADAERYNQIMSEVPAFGDDWQSNPALAEQVKFYQDSVAGAQPKTFTASGFGRTGDQYAEKPGERAAHMEQIARQEEQLLRDEKESNIGLTNYDPRTYMRGKFVNEEQQKSDANLFNNAALERFNMEDASYDANGGYLNTPSDDGIFKYDGLKLNPDNQPVAEDEQIYDGGNYNLEADDDSDDLGSELVIAEDLDKEEEKTEKIQVGPRWYESINDPENPTSIRSKIYNTIVDTGMDKMFDSIDDNSPQWLQDWAASIKTDIENRDWLKAGGKLWVTKAGSKYALKTLWKLMPFTNGKFLTAGNVIKIGVGAEVYEMTVDSEVPIMTQIQNKVEEVIAASKNGAVDGPEVIEVDGDGNVIVDDKKDDKKDDKPPLSALEVLRNNNAFSQFNGMGGATTNASSTPNAFNGGVTQQQGYTGNIMDMFTNLWNPNPAQSDYWYKTREGDIPGNNRMREAMARLAYMGLYPEDRGDDPYRQLSDDRIAYNNNQLDAASSQATLNATASNRQYTMWKNMLPSQPNLAKQLAESPGWASKFGIGMSQDELDKKADRDAGALLIKFHGLMAKGVAPTPENLMISNKLEQAGIPVNAQTVQYALENGLLDEKPPTDDSGGKTKTSSLISNTQGFLSSVKNAFN